MSVSKILTTLGLLTAVTVPTVYYADALPSFVTSTVIPALVTVVVVVSGIVLCFDTFEMLIGKVWLTIGKVFPWIKGAQKIGARHLVQGSINRFISKNKKNLVGLCANKVRLSWITEDSQESELVGKKVLVRIKKEDAKERIFVRAVCHFVSHSMLADAKRFMSPSQATSTDLQVSMNVIKSMGVSYNRVFREEYLDVLSGKTDEKTKLKKIRGYLSQFANLQLGGVFFEVFLHELSYIGQKTYDISSRTRVRNGIMEEIDGLIDYLEQFALRRSGDESVPLEFTGKYTKVCLMIVGVQHRLDESINRYVTYIEKNISPYPFNSLYLIGKYNNRRKILKIVRMVSDRFSYIGSRSSMRMLYGKERKYFKGVVVILRNRNALPYVPASEIHDMSLPEITLEDALQEAMDEVKEGHLQQTLGEQKEEEPKVKSK